MDDDYCDSSAPDVTCDTSTDCGYTYESVDNSYDDSGNKYDYGSSNDYEVKSNSDYYSYSSRVDDKDVEESKPVVDYVSWYDTDEAKVTVYYSKSIDEKAEDGNNDIGKSSEKEEPNKGKSDDSSDLEHVKNLANSIWNKIDPTPSIECEVIDYGLEPVEENDCECEENVEETTFMDDVENYPVASRSYVNPVVVSRSFVQPGIDKIETNTRSHKDFMEADSHSSKMKLSTVDKITVFLGELIGTGLLVFLGCMGCVKSDMFPNNHMQMTFAFGLVIMVMVQSFGCVSGAHLNPAVTVAATVYKLVTPIVAAIYFVAQMLGGFIGYGLLKALLPSSVVKPSDAAHGLCVTTPIPEISGIQAVGIEFVLTAVLIIVCCAVWDPRNAKHGDSVPIRFGLTIACLAMTGGPFTGASMNPARSFGPALWNADFTDHWIYWVGPLAAGAIGSIAYKAVFRREEPAEKDPKLRAMEELPLR